MDRAIEALEADDTETALELCKAMRTSGASSRRDAESNARAGHLVPPKKLGGRRRGRGLGREPRRGWKRDTGKIFERDGARSSRAGGQNLARHSGSATGRTRALHDFTEDEEKLPSR